MRKVILILAAISMANAFDCHSDGSNLAAQLESCKHQILREICEQENIKVWSKTTTNNNSIQADEINTSSTCQNLNITITSYLVDSTGLHVTYAPVPSTNSVHVVTMEQWNDIKVGATKMTGSVTKQARKDTTSVTEIKFSIRFDSNKLKELCNRVNNFFTALKGNP